jgi:RNA polymerase sigma-70 factor, ECF subfamily
VEFFEFNEEYLALLRASDPATCAHFFAYFDRLLRMLLRARGLPPDRVDDLIQETFLRVLGKVQRQGAIREPDHFGSYVNSVCKNAARETERSGKRADPIEDAHCEIPDKLPSAQAELEKREIKERVRKVLLGMPPKDRDLLREVFFLEKDKDEICRERGVDREYLRVLVHRAKTRFRADFEGK